jgi:biopolymer transport protein ExbB/TolQ
MLESTAIKNAIHWLSSVLEMPSIIILMLAVAIVLFELGSLFVEFFVERLRAHVDVRGLLVDIQGKSRKDVLELIESSAFPRHKKSAFRDLLTTDLNDESTEALAIRLISGEELRCQRMVQVTDIIARVAPMFGLMATLIPLGPGLIALGQGDTKTLSESLLTAFDATVSGLAAAGVAYIISRIRKRWYESDLTSMEAVMDGVLAGMLSRRNEGNAQ